MVTGSYFLFKCPWQKFKVGNSVLIGRFFFFKIQLCEIWKSWLKQNQRIGGQHLFMHIQVRLGVHYTLLLHCRGCIVILTITELNFAKFYVNTYSTFQGTVEIIFSSNKLLQIIWGSVSQPESQEETDYLWGLLRVLLKSLLCWLANKINNLPLT